MSNHTPLTAEHIDLLYRECKVDPHFESIVLPRLLFLNKLKELFTNENQLEWKLLYSPVNKSSNCIRISLKDPNEKFAFYYEIPLMQRFDLFLFLGNNTFNFFEAYPLLLSKEVMQEGDYKIKATSRVLPHLDLNIPRANFERPLLNQNVSLDEINNSQIFKNISMAFNKFNAPLFNIIHSKWLL